MLSLFEAHQLLAARAVLLPDRESWLRSVFRWYSRTFHTPLHDVYDLPLEFVLQNYYEGCIEDLDEEGRERFYTEVIKTPEERAAEDVKGVESVKADDDFFEKLNAEAKAQTFKGPPKERRKKFDPKQFAAKGAAAKPPVPPPPPADGPGFSVSFGGNLEEEIGDFDPLAPPPRKK